MARTLFVVAGLMLGALVLLASSGGLMAQKGHPRWAGGDLQIRGYDTTAYAKKGRAAVGVSSNVVRWNGGVWRFQTAADAAAFKANPAAYVPQFGAYCTGGLSQQHVVNGNPGIWRIHKGKLYLFYAEAGGRRFDKDPEGVIAAARAYAKTVGIKEN